MNFWWAHFNQRKIDLIQIHNFYHIPVVLFSAYISNNGLVDHSGILDYFEVQGLKALVSIKFTFSVILVLTVSKVLSMVGSSLNLLVFQ